MNMGVTTMTSQQDQQDEKVIAEDENKLNAHFGQTCLTFYLKW